ncbi:MAG: hypothetical protein ACRBCL_09085 [Maritimibacter sp.]
MRKIILTAAFFGALAPPVFAADPLSFDIGRDRVLISCGAFLAAQLEVDTSLTPEWRERMNKSMMALFYKANIARAPEEGPLRDTHRESVNARATVMAQAFQFRMKKNLDAHGTISGDDLLLLDEQIVCRDLYRQLEAEARG